MFEFLDRLSIVDGPFPSAQDIPAGCFSGLGLHIKDGFLLIQGDLGFSENKRLESFHPIQ